MVTDGLASINRFSKVCNGLDKRISVQCVSHVLKDQGDVRQKLYAGCVDIIFFFGGKVHRTPYHTHISNSIVRDSTGTTDTLRCSQKKHSSGDIPPNQTSQATPKPTPT